MNDQYIVDSYDIYNKDGFYITISLKGVECQTLNNYGHIYIARHPIEIMRVSEVHKVAGNDINNVTLDIQILNNGQVTGSGTSILNSQFNLKSTENTVVTKEGSDLSTNRILLENERLCIYPIGTLTNLQDLLITIYCKHANRGSYL